MCNAAKFLTAIILASGMLTASCGGDPDKEKVEALLVEINTSLEQGDYRTALALMDTIDQHYPSQIEARRQVIALRPQGIEKETLAQMAAADSAIVFAQTDLQGLEGQMKHISGDDLEGYYVYADAYNPKFINTTGIEPRVNDADFTFYIVAQTLGKSQGISAIELQSQDGATAVSDLIPSNSERRFDIEGSEMAVFIPEEVESLGQWAKDAGTITSAKILTGRGPVPVKLSPAQQKAYAVAYRYADAKSRLQHAVQLRSMLEARLQIARDQIANTSNNE